MRPGTKAVASLPRAQSTAKARARAAASRMEASSGGGVALLEL